MTKGFKTAVAVAGGLAMTLAFGVVSPAAASTAPTEPPGSTAPVAELNNGENVTLKLLADNTHDDLAADRRGDVGVLGVAPERVVRRRAAPGRYRRRQHRQDPPGHERDGRRVLLQLGVVAAGAQPDRDARRPHRRSDARQRRRCVHPDGEPGRRGVRRAVRHRSWAAASSTTGRSSRTTACRSRTTWAEFEANNAALLAGRDHTGRRLVRRRRGRRSCSCSPTTTTSSQAVPDFAERYTANEAHYADTPAALLSFQRLQEGYDQGWWNEDYGSATYEDALADADRRRHRPVPDADVRAAGDRRARPRGGPEHRLLRPARTRCGHQRHDAVDAGGRLHRRHDRARGRGAGVPRLHRLGRRARRPRPRRPRRVGRTSSRVRRCPTTCCRR